MRKSILFLLLAGIIASNTAYYLLKSDWAERGEEPPPPPAAAIPFAPAATPPPPEMMGHGARLPTPEELADEARYEETRVEEVGTWLNSPLAGKRAIGAEQLSAFPTPSAERLLVNALALDFAVEVRKAAAQSLSTFKQPTDKAVAALLGALEDDSEEVQTTAMNALFGIAAKLENGSPPLRSLLAGLNNQAAARHLKTSTRQTIRAFLKDQAPSKGFDAGRESAASRSGQ